MVLTVRYGKNLKDITCTENWDNVSYKLLQLEKMELIIESTMYQIHNIQFHILKTVSFEQN